MFEREVKFIYDFNSNKVKKLGPTATFTELLPLGIHPSILQYISAEIEFRVFEDRQSLLKHSMFDYSGTRITQHFQKIADEIKKEKRFSTDFISKVILHAVSFNVNYLIRPNWSLKKLIFDTGDSNNVAEILQILNYAYFYKHVIKVIRNYLDKKKLITLDKDEFSELLIKFDKVSIETYGKDVLESAIKAMSSFFNIGSMKQNTVPLQGIAVFLQEKKLTSHIEKIQNNIDGEIKGKITVNDLRSILLNIPIERTEVLDLPQEPEEEKVSLENESLPIEEEKDEYNEEEILREEPSPKIAEETKPEIEDFEPEPIEEEKKSDDIEIKLRENKEKEVAEIEDQQELAQEIEEEEETQEISLEPEEEEFGVDRESEPVALEDEDINEAAEYLVDQTEKVNPDIILTAEDEENFQQEDQKEIIEQAVETKEELQTEEEIERINEEEVEELVFEDDQDEELELEEQVAVGDEFEIEEEIVHEDESVSESEIEDNIEESSIHIEEESEVPHEEEVDQTLEPSEEVDEELETDEEAQEIPETEKEEVHLINEAYHPTEDDYSHPPFHKEEVDEEKFEELDELEIEDEDHLSVEETADDLVADEYIAKEEDELEQSVAEDDEGIIEEESSLEEMDIEDEDATQASLFGEMPEEELIEKSEPEEDFIESFGNQNHTKRIDIADLLENKNMTKIIAVVFDYDMEEFANAIEKICDSKSSQEAFGTLDEIFEFNQVNPFSKEAQAFREIIAEYFEQE